MSRQYWLKKPVRSEKSVGRKTKLKNQKKYKKKMKKIKKISIRPTQREA